MHVWGISVDLDSIAPFLFTAFLIFYGLVYVVKNTASKYFVVDASFEGGGGVVESLTVEKEEECGIGKVRVVDSEMKVDMSCVVCGEIGTKQCSSCRAVRYCNVKCQVTHWKSGHKENCGKGVVAKACQNTLEKKVLFPYDEFVKLYNWDNPGFPPCGLFNCGNSCFANVVLQCLTYTKPLTAYLLTEGHQSGCKKNGWCFLCEFETHVERASSSRHAFSPVNIVSRLPHIGGNLGFGNQEDAHEFMRFAIDSMQSVFLDEFGGEKALHPSSLETTLIQYIFGGHLLSQVQCITCSKVSNRYESMMDLTVEIHGDNASLEECLDQFTAPEWLDGDNKYKCDGCNAYVRARKLLSIQQPPNILTIALKRFQSGRFGKLNKRVTFPETLNLSRYLTNPDDIDIYHLYAVVVHIDMLNASYFGHYICYIKDFNGDWYKVDDCKVVDVDLEEVLSAAAYMLLYCRYRPRESYQTPTKPPKGPLPVEKSESCSTSLQSVATSSSVSADISRGTHIPIKPFSACDFGNLETKDEATSKHISPKHENGKTRSLSPSNGVVVHDNGYSNPDYCLEDFQQSVLNDHTRSDSGCSSSTGVVSISNGNEHAWEVLNVTDPMEICNGDGLMHKENGDKEQSEKRTGKRKKEIGADIGLSDVCTTGSPKQKKKDGYEGLFSRGFLNQNEYKLNKKINSTTTDPPTDASMFMNGTCCSSIVDAACSPDTSPKEKLGSDVEEMLCSDVKGDMNMSIFAGKISEQEGIGSLHTAIEWPPSSPEGKCHADNDKLPSNRNYYSADSAECAKNIQIDTVVTSSSPNAQHLSANGSAEIMCDSNTDHVNGSPPNTPSSNGKFCPNRDALLSSPSSTSLSGGSSVSSLCVNDGNQQ